MTWFGGRASLLLTMDETEMEGGGDAKHKYRIAEVLPREKRTGRPKRLTVIAWDDLTEEEVAVLRRLHEPRLQINQIAELDGRTVARGSGVTQADADESEPAVEEPPRAPRNSPAAELTDFAHKICWEIVERDRVASEEIRRQSHLLNERSIEQGKQLDAMISELAALRIQLMRQAPQSGARISIEDIKNIMTIGATVVRDVMKGSGSSGSGS